MEPVGPHRRNPLRDGVFLVITCAALVALWRLVTTPGIWDDAYISLTAARNLLGGHGLHFSPRLEDYALSSLAWPTLVAVVSVLPGDLVAALRLTGIASELFLAISFGLLAYVALDRHLGCALLAVAILLSNPVLLFSTHWGMETALYVSLIAAASLALALERPQLCLLIAAAAPWTRVDGLAFYLLALALVLTDRLSHWPRLADAARARLLATAGVLVWSLLLFGDVRRDAAALLAREACRERVYGAASEVLSRPLTGLATPFLAADEIGVIGFAAPPGVNVLDLLGLSHARQGDVRSTVLALRPAAWITLQSHWPEDVERGGLAELEWLEPRIPCARPLLIGLRRDLVYDGTLDPSSLEEEIELRLSREAQSIRR